MRVAKVVGGATDSGWSQVHIFFPEKRKRKMGAMLAVVALERKKLKVDSEIGLAAVGTEVIQRIHELYYGNSAEEGLDRVVKALDKTSLELSGEVEISMVMAVMVKDEEREEEVLYGGVVNQGRLLVARGGKVLTLLVGRGRREARGVSGVLQRGDLVFLGTELMFEVVEEEKLADWLKMGRAELVADRLAPAVHSKDSSLVAGVIADWGDNESKDISGEGKRVLGKIKVDAGHKWRLEKLDKGRGREILGQWRDKLAEMIAKKGDRRKREIYVEERGDKKRKVIGTVVVVLGLLLAISLGFGWVRIRNSEEFKIFEEVRTEVERRVSESEKLTELNPLRSRALLVEAEQIVADYKASGELSQKAEEWTRLTGEELKDKLLVLLKINEVGKPEVFLDLDLVREGSRGVEMDFDGESLLVLDGDSSVVLAIEVDNKKAAVVGGGSLLGGAEHTAVYFGRGFVLADEGIVELDLKRKTSSKVVDRDDKWGKIGAMDVFGGNLYLIDNEKGKIYRYRGIEGGFGSEQEWLGSGVGPDFTKVISMAIDGNIWILTASGKIEVYSQGSGKGFEIEGLSDQLVEPKAIYTAEESEWVYILDGGLNRVVVVNKEGIYESQYVWEGVDGVDDMVVAEEEGKILLLAEDIIYEIELVE